MARVALVTGGTRGIGGAISKALKDAGYTVAASYAGNDTAAEKFKAETGIPVYKWDVSSFEACAEGVKKVEADLGPADGRDRIGAEPPENIADTPDAEADGDQAEHHAHDGAADPIGRGFVNTSKHETVRLYG